MSRQRSDTEASARRALLRNGVFSYLEQGAHLQAILDRLIANIEAQADQMLAAVFFYDPASKDLSVGCAPHLQPSYLRAVNGFKVGALQPACGSAVFRRQRVISSDIRLDPSWDPYRHFAEAVNFRAIWSEPIFGVSGDVLGTLAFYFPTPKSPDASDLMVLECAAEIAATVIQARKEQVRALIEARRRELEAAN